MSNGTVDKAAYQALPPAPSGSLIFPSQQQMAAAQQTLAQQWASKVG